MSNRWIERSAARWQKCRRSRDKKHRATERAIHLAARFRPREERLGGSANFIGDPRFRRNKLRREPREQPDQVVRDENLPIAMRTRTDADRRNPKGVCDLARCF